MNIFKTNGYKKDYKKKIVDKHLYKEIDRIRNIEELILDHNNLKELTLNPLSNIYHIEQKTGNLKEYYTARVNEKIRLFMKPIGDYPYNKIEITSIDFIKIDDKHYGEG